MNEDFKEVAESYTLPEAIKEAQRCLHCKVPGCKKGCPISNDIPDWIGELAHGNFGTAIATFPPSADAYAPTNASARATAYSPRRVRPYTSASSNAS